MTHRMYFHNSVFAKFYHVEKKRDENVPYCLLLFIYNGFIIMGKIYENQLRWRYMRI